MEGKRPQFRPPFARGPPQSSGSGSGSPASEPPPSLLGAPQSSPDSSSRERWRATSTSNKRLKRESESPFKRFKVTPSSANADDFKLCNPFIRIDKRNPDVWEREAANKFSFGKVDRDTLAAFFAWGPGRMIRRTLRAFQNTVGEELKYRAALSQLFPTFTMISKKFAVLELKRGCITEGEDEDKLDYVSLGDSSQSPFFNQACHEYGDAVDGHQSVDYALMTFPKKKVEQIIETAKAWGAGYEDTLANAFGEIKNWKCAALLDAKDDSLAKMWPSKYVYQLGLYATQVMEGNLEKGYVRPAYMICISDSAWRLAMLDAFGTIEVKDHDISEESFHVFEEQQKLRFSWFEKKKASPRIMKTPFTRENMKTILATSDKEFRALGHSGVPDGKYVVGFYYVDHTTYTWDGNLEALNNKDPISLGTLRLMEGLLRLLVGERVCAWTKEKIKELLKEAEKEEEEWCGIMES